MLTSHPWPRISMAAAALAVLLGFCVRALPATVTPSSPAGGADSWLQDWNGATTSDGNHLLPAAGDTAIINQNRTIVVDSPVAVTAGSVTVNNTIGSPLPNARLEIAPGGALGTGAITISQNTDPGVLEIRGGSLTASGAVTVRENGGFLLTSGSFVRGGSGGRTVFADTNGAGGPVHVSGGSFTALGSGPADVLGLLADTIRISGGNFVVAGGQAILADTTTLVIEGSAPSVTIDRLNLNLSSRAAVLRFELDAAGLSPIHCGGYANLSNAVIEIDGSAYAGGPASIDLVVTPDLLAPSTHVSVTGLGEEGVDYNVIQDPVAELVRLEISGLYSARAAVEALGGWTGAPAVFEDDVLPGSPASIVPGAVARIYYDGPVYQGNPTRVCAWLGVPAGADVSHPVPAVVLAHGGGGRPYAAWVEKWNQRGYAAIAMGLEGQTDVAATPQQIDAGQSVGAWLKHNMPGPARVGIYGDSDAAIGDQWMYHAVADVILANSLMRSLPFVDSSKVGVIGVSWGGVVAATAIGVDDRFAFAIPVYGAGHKFDIPNHFGNALSGNTFYRHVWDPLLRIDRASMPALWLSWPGESNFSLDSQAHTYRAAGGPRMVSLIPGMGHSHPSAWNRPEGYDFADSVVATGEPWCSVVSSARNGSDVEVVFDSIKPLLGASLIHTADVGHTGGRSWVETPVESITGDPSGRWTVNAVLPSDTTAWFVNAWALSSDIDANSDGVSDTFGYAGGHLVAGSGYEETRGLTVAPPGPLVIRIPSNVALSSSALDLGFLGMEEIEIIAIEITGESHPGAFSHEWSLPRTLDAPLPARLPLAIRFDNRVAGLTDSSPASGTLVISWRDPSDAAVGEVVVPLSAELAAPAAEDGYDFSRVFPVSESWSSAGPRAVLSDIHDPADASTWAVSFPETDVFAFSMKGVSPDLGDWVMRVGKGGQVFSIRVNGQEWMAPQFRSGAAPDRAPWIDEVIQPVALNRDLDTEANPYFIHGAGIYLDDPAFAVKPFHSPMLASRIDPGDSRLHTLNWAQQAHVPTSYRSGLIHFQRITDRGGGIVEIERVLHNAGAETLDWFNLPWMGVRLSSLPKHYLYSGGGRIDRSESLFGNPVVTPLVDTDGFASFTTNDTEDSPCLMVVFGNNPPAGPAGFVDGTPDWRDGIAGTGMPDPLPEDEASWRNLRVGTARYPVVLAPDESLYERSFLVIGRESGARLRIAAHGLVSRSGVTKLDYGQPLPDEWKPWYASREGAPLEPVETADAAQQAWFATSQEPVAGWRPLLILEDATKSVLADDFYHLAHPSGPPADAMWKPYNGNTGRWRLLGFVPDTAGPITGGGASASSVAALLVPGNTINGSFGSVLFTPVEGSGSVVCDFKQGAGGWFLRHRVPPGWSYGFERSNNLRDWSPFGSGGIGTNTGLELPLPPPDAEPFRVFYRMKHQLPEPP